MAFFTDESVTGFAYLRTYSFVCKVMVLFLTLVPVIILSRDFSTVKISIEYEMTLGEVTIPHR